MICLFSRRRLGAYLDGALGTAAARVMEAHLGACGRCQRQAAGLRRMHAVLREVMAAPAQPDWAGFWPGIVRGIQDVRRPAAALPRRRWSPKWAISGTALAAAALTLVVWYQPSSIGPEDSVEVTSAQTQYPGGTMVYHTPDKVAVVWVFDE